MGTRSLRNIALLAFCMAVILFIIDVLFVFYDSWFDGAGIISTFILPPIGIRSAVLAYRRSDSRIDGLLILANLFAFFLYFAFMFFGTLLFGP